MAGIKYDKSICSCKSWQELNLSNQSAVVSKPWLELNMMNPTAVIIHGWNKI